MRRFSLTRHYFFPLVFIGMCLSLFGMDGAEAEESHAVRPGCRLPDKFEHHPKLDDKQNRLVLEIISKARSYGDCTDTVECCLGRKEPSKFSVRLWWSVARMVANGFTKDEVFEELSRRRKSFDGPVKKIETDSRPILGNPKAPVVVVEFSDFECPYCRRTAVVLRDVLSRFSKEQVALVYKFFPLLKAHPQALGAARLGVQAMKEGKFWKLYDRLTSNPPDLAPDALRDLARELGLKGPGFDDPLTLDPIDQDIKEGNKLGIDGVPAVFVNGREYFGFRDHASLAERILEELDRKGVKPEKPRKTKERE